MKGRKTTLTEPKRQGRLTDSRVTEKNKLRLKRTSPTRSALLIHIQTSCCWRDGCAFQTAHFKIYLFPFGGMVCAQFCFSCDSIPLLVFLWAEKDTGSRSHDIGIEVRIVLLECMFYSLP